MNSISVKLPHQSPKRKNSGEPFADVSYLSCCREPERHEVQRPQIPAEIRHIEHTQTRTAHRSRTSALQKRDRLPGRPRPRQRRRELLPTSAGKRHPADRRERIRRDDNAPDRLEADRRAGIRKRESGRFAGHRKVVAVSKWESRPACDNQGVQQKAPKHALETPEIRQRGRRQVDVEEAHPVHLHRRREEQTQDGGGARADEAQEGPGEAAGPQAPAGALQEAQHERRLRRGRLERLDSRPSGVRGVLLPGGVQLPDSGPPQHHQPRHRADDGELGEPQPGAEALLRPDAAQLDLDAVPGRQQQGRAEEL